MLNWKTSDPSSYEVSHSAELETRKPLPHRDQTKWCIQQQHETPVLLYMVLPYTVFTRWDWANKKATKFQFQDKLGDASAT